MLQKNCKLKIILSLYISLRRFGFFSLNWFSFLNWRKNKVKQSSLWTSSTSKVTLLFICRLKKKQKLYLKAHKNFFFFGIWFLKATITRKTQCLPNKHKEEKSKLTVCGQKKKLLLIWRNFVLFVTHYNPLVSMKNFFPWTCNQKVTKLCTVKNC